MKHYSVVPSHKMTKLKRRWRPMYNLVAAMLFFTLPINASGHVMAQQASLRQPPVLRQPPSINSSLPTVYTTITNTQVMTPVELNFDKLVLSDRINTATPNSAIIQPPCDNTVTRKKNSLLLKAATLRHHLKRIGFKCSTVSKTGIAVAVKWISRLAWMSTILLFATRLHQPQFQWFFPAVKVAMRMFKYIRRLSYITFTGVSFILRSWNDKDRNYLEDFTGLNVVIHIALNALAAAVVTTLMVSGALLRELWNTALFTDELCFVSMLSLSIVATFINHNLSRKPSYWVNVGDQPVGSDELNEIRKAMRGRLRPAHMEVVAAYKIDAPLLEEQYTTFQENLRGKGHPYEPQLLFHGTSFPSAKSIVSKGFKLGDSGAFGGGIYFAETPLKSLAFSSPHRDERLLLVCDVLMGRSRIVKCAQDVNPQRDLYEKKRHHFRWGIIVYKEFIPRSYDSLTARPSKLFPFASINIPEFVVYRKEQVMPRYILVVKPRRT